MIANAPVPEDSSEEDQEQALERLFELIEESGHKRTGCLIQYIDPEKEIPLQNGVTTSGVISSNSVLTTI